MTQTLRVAIRSTRCYGPFPRAGTDCWTMIGQDGGQSINLGEETLFVFSDTLFVPLHNADDIEHARVPFATQLGDRGFFLGNSAGLSRDRDLRQAMADVRYYTDQRGFPREILVPTAQEREEEIRFWPEHGILIDDKVYLYYLGIQTIDHSSIWGFQNLGVGLAELDPRTGACQRLRRGDDWCLWRAGADDFHFGTQVVRAGEHVYVFGSLRRDDRTWAIVARVGVDRIGDPLAYEYLHSQYAEWHHSLEEACSLGECGPDYSVSYNPYLEKYLMVYVEGHSKMMMLRTADDLLGPYAPPRKIGRVPHEPASELVYLAFEHPKFRASDGERIYVTYCQPHFTPNTMVEVRFR